MKRYWLLTTALALAACGDGAPSNEVPDSAVAADTPAAPTSPNLVEYRDGPAFEAAANAVLGGTDPVMQSWGGEQMEVRPLRLIQMTDHAVFLAEGENQADCHACEGAASIYYLDSNNGVPRVRQRYEAIVHGPSWGDPPKLRRVAEDLAPHPVLVFEGSYTGQGVTRRWFDLVALTPEGPVKTATIEAGGTNRGFVGVDSPELDESEAEIVPNDNGEGFLLRFTGTREETRIYTYADGKFTAGS